MHRTRIKFCGITRPEDAAAAAAAGADAIGLVFHAPAARGVSVERAAAILAVLPPFVTAVGLFVDAPPERVLDVAGRLRLTTVQLHGEEPPEAVARLAGLSVVKAVRAAGGGVAGGGVAGAVAAWRGIPLAGLLLETAGGPGVGGTGVANDWPALAAARRAGVLDGLPPLVAAGGLTPDTVARVVRSLRPFAVDVSSGIERVRGVKDAARMAAFAAAVAAADARVASDVA